MRKIYNRIFGFAFAVLASASLASCSSDCSVPEDPEVRRSGPSQEVSINVSCGIDRMESTKAVFPHASYEAVEDLVSYFDWYIYSSEGNFIKSGRFTPGRDTKIDVVMHASLDYRIYAMANSVAIEPAPVTETAMKAAFYENASNGGLNSEVAQGPRLIMCGVADIVRSGSTASVEILLKRLVSKVVVSIDKSGLNPDVSVEFNTATLTNIPSKVMYFADNVPSSGCTASASAPVTTGPVTFYSYENAQGVLLPDNTGDQGNRHKFFPDGSKYENLCTYVSLKGYYSSPTKRGDIVYRMYLGANSTDFSLLRNRQYNVTVDFNGNGSIDEATWRVVVTDIQDLATGISISMDDTEIGYDESVPFSAVLTPSTVHCKHVKWEVSDASLVGFKPADGAGVLTLAQLNALEDNCGPFLIYGLKNGEGAITATTTDGTALSASKDFTVNLHVPVSSIVVTPATKTLYIGETVQLKATASPAFATDPSVTWSTADPAKALVSDAGLVTAKGEGEVVITATANDDHTKKGTAAITVLDRIDYYDDPVVTLAYNPASFTAAGGTAVPACTYEQTAHWLSGRTTKVTEGGSVTYDIPTPVSGFSMTSDGKVTVAANPAEVDRSAVARARVTLNGKTGSANATIMQGKAVILVFDAPVVSLSYSPTTIVAAGGTSVATCTYRQVAHWSNGSTTEVTTGGALTYSVIGTGFSVASNGTVTAQANPSESDRTATASVKVVLNGKEGTASVRLTQTKSVVISFDTPTVSLSYSPASFNAAGGTSTPACTYEQKVHWSNGTTSRITTGASLSFSRTSGSSDFVVASNGTVTVRKNTTSNDRTASFQVAVGLNGKTGTASATISQAKPVIIDFDAPVLSLSYGKTSFNAGGGTTAPVCTYSQKIHWDNGTTTTVTTGGALVYSLSSTDGFAVSSDGTVTVAKNMTGSARSTVSSVKLTINGKTATKTVTISQAAPVIISFDEPEVSLAYSPATFNAAGGTAVPSCSYTQTAHWDNGNTTSVTSGGSVTYRFKTNVAGFTLASDGSGKVSVATNPSENDRSAVVVATVALNGKSGSGNATISQGKSVIVSFDDPVVALSYSPSTIVAAGGTSVPACTCEQTAHWSDGRSTKITSGATLSYSLTSAVAGFSIDAGGTVTATPNASENDRSVNVKLVVTMNGKSVNKFVTITQSKSVVINFGTPEVTLSYTPSSVNAKGGSCKPSCSYKQTVTWSDGRTTTVTTGGTVTYDIPIKVTGFSINASTGVVSVAENMTESERQATAKVSVKVNGITGTATSAIRQGAPVIIDF